MNILTLTSTISNTLLSHSGAVWTTLAIILILALVGIMSLIQAPLYDDMDIQRDIEQNTLTGQLYYKGKSKSN